MNDDIEKQLTDLDLLRVAKEWTTEQSCAHLALAIPSNVRHKILLKAKEQAKTDAYSKLRKILLDYVDKTTNKSATWKEFTNVIIKPGETVKSFFERISRLLESVRPDWRLADRDFLIRPKIIASAPPVYEPILQS